jgi:16S rRNA (guanine527-N7)-methyltransferase
LNKRISFLNHLKDVLALSNVNFVHGRAEEVSRNLRYRDHFDLVTARAVAKLPLLNELCLPFVKVDGIFIALKGSNFSDEVISAQNSLHLLNAKLEHVHTLQLPGDEAARNLIHIKKLSATPDKYPRKPGIPERNPL